MKIVNELRKEYDNKFKIEKYKVELVKKSNTINEMAGHLALIFDTVVEMKPRFIVELGTGNGNSTFAFIRGADIVGCPLLTVDKDDRSYVFTDPNIVSDIKPNWTRLQAEDVELGKRWKEFTREKGLPEAIDILFIDTDHERGHTKSEIITFVPYLSENHLIMLHDAAILELGVYSGLEDLLGKSYDWHTEFADESQGWKIHHRPNCCGLTFLHRVDLKEPIQMKIAG